MRKGWGSVARRGASAVRADDGVTRKPVPDSAEGRRQARTRDDEFIPERFERVDDRDRKRGSPSGTAEAPARPSLRRPQRPAEGLPADVLDELGSAAGSDWGMLRDRISERMTAGLGAYRRERYRDASRILKTVVDAVPNAPSARELLGLSHYHQGHWKAALVHLEAYGELTGSVDQHPVRMDCQRAVGRPKRVEALFAELRQGSPDPEVLSEGRLVLAATRADRGDLAGAVSVLVEAGAGRRVRNPAERHIRQWYVLADLMERSGDLARSRELFLRISEAEPHAYDVDERLDALGPPSPRRRPSNRPQPAR